MTHAIWRKCDFQIHTPRDPNWTGPRPVGLGDLHPITKLPASIEEVEAARLEWAVDFVAKCEACGLQVIALTDHHEMFMIPYVQQAIKLRKEVILQFDLWLFPGMELTAWGGRQCLILFDVDLSQDWWTQAQGKLSIAYASIDKTASRSPSITQLTCSYADIQKELDSVPGLSGHFIVLPNVSQGNSHTVLVDKAHADFKRMDCVGAYLDRGQTIDTLGPSNRKRLSGEAAIWTNRCVYPMPTSDSRAHDFATIGTNQTWIKLAEPTAEAIRQAFLGHNSRFCINEAPKCCSLSISEVNIRGSSVLSDTRVVFSRELNTIIGGRGSGKSSLLEYIAFGLGRSCFDVKREHYSNTSRMHELIHETLIGPQASISLKLIQDEAVFVIERGPATSYQPQITYPNGTKQLLTTKELRALFPAVVYSQGELAEIGKQAGQKTQLADLLQFVDASYKKEDDRLKFETEQAKTAVRLSVQNLATHWDRLSQIRKLTTRLASLQERIAALEKTLPQLDTADQTITKIFEEANAFEAHRIAASRHANEIMSKVNALGSEIAPTSSPSSEIQGTALQFHTVYKNFVSAYIKSVADLRNMLQAHRAALSTAEANWSTELIDARRNRDKVLEKLGAHRTATSQIVQLREEAMELTNRIGELDAIVVAAEDPADRMRDSVDALRKISSKRSERTESWAQLIASLSNNKIVATVAPFGDVNEIIESIEIISAKTGSQEASRLRALEQELQSSTADVLLGKVRSECLALLHWRLVGQHSGEDMPAASTLFKLIGDRERTRGAFMDRLDVARVQVIASAITLPKIALTYADGDRQIGFEKASEGQRASALLFILLEQAGGPLMIDQPEGDLDNKIIADLTQKLHGAKQNRQLLFVSHNANIVVNGSSELVAQLGVDVTGQRRIQNAGSIEAAAICSVITSTMEGGEKAFKARQDKYGY